MIINKSFAIVGGDARFAYLANSLAAKESGHKIYSMFFDKSVKLSHKIVRTPDIKLVLPQSDITVFPLPMLDADGNLNTPLYEERVSWEECFEYILPGSVVVGGKVPEAVLESAQRKNIEVVDYMEREEFAVLNAIPTAEGAVEIALGEMPVTLFGSTCLVVGFGRIAKVLTRLLVAFGAKVYVAARRHSDIVWARIYGATPLHISELSKNLVDVDVLYNTIPATILGEDKLSKLRRDCLVIDLASKPGGVDFEAANSLGLKTIRALSLPGKVAPISAAEAILDTIWGILSERGTV